MKILVISDAWHPQVNGVVRTYEHLGEELEKRGHIFSVIGPADFPLRMPLPGYAEIKLALWPYRRLEKLIKLHAPDHIHIATEGPLGWAGRRACLKHRIAFTTAYHTQFPDYAAKRIAWFTPFAYRKVYEKIREMGKAYVRRFHAPASAVMVATPSLEAELRSWDFQSPLHRVTRGASLEQFFPGPPTLFHDLKRPVALYVGRVAIEKNLEAFLDMPWHGSKVIVGDGPVLETMRHRYPDILFAGVQTGKDLADHYRSADVFVFPSRTDTFGMVLIEALACGLPVAGFDVTGPRDIITQPFLGATHADDLSQASLRALSCGGTAGQRAEWVKSHYTWDRAAIQFEQAVMAACGQS